MANSPQARKRAKQADVRRNHNASLRSRARTYVKKTLAAITAVKHKLQRMLSARRHQFLMGWSLKASTKRTSVLVSRVV